MKNPFIIQYYNFSILIKKTNPNPDLQTSHNKKKLD
jgi:hypothetical protein